MREIKNRVYNRDSRTLPLLRRAASIYTRSFNKTFVWLEYEVYDANGSTIRMYGNIHRIMTSFFMSFYRRGSAVPDYRSRFFKLLRPIIWFKKSSQFRWYDEMRSYLYCSSRIPYHYTISTIDYNSEFSQVLRNIPRWPILNVACVGFHIAQRNIGLLSRLTVSQ